MFILVSYDIVDDKRRKKICDTILDFGDRVQYSVFEMDIDENQLIMMKNRISRYVNLEEDSIRIYKLCNSCLEKIEIIGQGEVLEDKDIYII